MMQIRNIEVVAAGRKWNGSWHVEGSEVVLSSAYGSERAKAGKDPKATAVKLLAKLITAGSTTPAQR